LEVLQPCDRLGPLAFGVALQLSDEVREFGSHRVHPVARRICKAAPLRAARVEQLSGGCHGRRRDLMRLAALAIVAAALGCSSKMCAGVGTCYRDQPSQCQKIPGCAATPGCVVNPTLGLDCAAEITQDSCLSDVLAVRCTWANGACSGPCNAATDTATCQSIPECSWSACSGTPRSCDAYSADSCPTSPLGCYVTTDQNGRLFE
jgi:hypothetical protein